MLCTWKIPFVIVMWHIKCMSNCEVEKSEECFVNYLIAFTVVAET